MITGLTGIGASRRVVDNIHNTLTNNWGQRLYSCIAMMKPFQVSFVLDSNDGTWITNLQAIVGAMLITWPAESGYTTGGTLAFQGNFTDVTFGSPDIEGRVEGSMTIHPSGKPTLTAGTHP